MFILMIIFVFFFLFPQNTQGYFDQMFNNHLYSYDVNEFQINIPINIMSLSVNYWSVINVNLMNLYRHQKLPFSRIMQCLTKFERRHLTDISSKSSKAVH